MVDIREQGEYESGSLAGSRHMPYRLLRKAGSEVAEGKTVVTICKSGARAGIAASVLAAAGVHGRPVLDGGGAGWLARHRSS